MEKELRAHYQQTLEEIEKFEKSTLTSEDESPRLRRQIRVVYRTHQVRVRDFQHERLIHLLVTFFFGFLFLLALATLFVMQLFIFIGGNGILTLLVGILAGILLITELFYIRHYYQLENGVQRLYKLTDRLQKLLS